MAASGLPAPAQSVVVYLCRLFNSRTSAQEISIEDIDSSIRDVAGKVKTQCLAQAGITPQQWQAKQATSAQGVAVKSCMAQHGINITVTRRDGSTF